MKRIMLVCVIALGAAVTLAHASATDAWAGCGGKGEVPCPPPSNDREKKQHQAPTVPPTATFTATPEPTATTSPTQTNTPAPTATQVLAAVAAVPPPASASAQPDCWAWPGLLVSGVALFGVGSYFRSRQLGFVAQVNEVAVRGYDTSHRREIGGPAPGAAIRSMALPAGVALYAGATLGLEGAAGWILGIACGPSLPAALAGVAFGAAVALLMSRSAMHGPSDYYAHGVSTRAAASTSDHFSSIRGFDVEIEDGSAGEAAQDGTWRSVVSSDEGAQAAGKGRAAVEPGGAPLRFGERLQPPRTTPLGSDEPDVRYTLFLPDGTPARDTAHVAMKNPSKTASKTSSKDSSGDKDGDGDSS